jgi:hypothetical protein
MHQIRREAAALALCAAVGAQAEAHARVQPARADTAASVPAAAPAAVAPDRRQGAPWSDDMPAGRATALLVLAGIGMLGLRANRHRP